MMVTLAIGAAACAAGGAPAQSEPAAPSEVAPTTPPPSAPAEAVASPVAEAPAAPATESPQLSWETKDSGVTVPDEWRACSAPDDCQLVVTTCCDQCNGGKAVSVAKSHVADAQAKFKPTGCGGCTKRGCSTRALCEAGRCVLQWQSFR